MNSDNAEGDIELQQPALSVVVPADRYGTIAKVMNHLRRQTIADRIEVVIATPSEAALAMPEKARDGLHSVKVVEIGHLRSTPRARAFGIRGATAPVVAIGETHSYPDADWAEALVRAHEGPWSVVGPRLSNANPDSLISWAGMLLDYGPFLDTDRRGEQESLPGHNSSFKTQALVAYGDELEHKLKSDTELIADLRQRGHRLFLEPRARTNHLNMTKPHTWIVERVSAGWDFAAYRCLHWSRARRVLYTLGAPLIPAVRMRRVLRDLRASGHADELLPRVLPAVFAGAALMSFGEMLGYAFGQGPTRRLYHYEIRRIDYVKRARSAA